MTPRVDRDVSYNPCRDQTGDTGALQTSGAFRHLQEQLAPFASKRKSASLPPCILAVTLGTLDPVAQPVIKSRGNL